MIDPGILSLQADTLSSTSAKYFLRGTTIASDVVLFAGAAALGKQVAPTRAWVPFVLVVSNSALMIVDHIHFQYNGLLLGVLFLSIAAHLRGQIVLGGLWFAVLINLKHLYLVLAPVQFIYILRGWVWGPEWPGRFLAVGGAVTAVFYLSVGPVVATGRLGPFLQRCARRSLYT